MSGTTSESTALSPPPLPSLQAQAEHLIELGVPALAGVDLGQARAVTGTVMADDDVARPGAAARRGQWPPDDQTHHTGPPLLVIPGAPVAALAPLMRRAGKPGFVVQDMTDVEEFVPIDGLEVPTQPYLLHGIDRGDDLRNASPQEAQAQFAAAGRFALTLTEGIYWVLAQPEVLAPNYCFMTIASRRPKPRGGLDARTPALWISGGTGRDGKERRGAAKVGWCWARNRHTWLGFASAGGRTPVLAT